MLRGVFRVSLAASLLIEVIQFAERSIGLARWTDVDDALLNVVGAMLGSRCSLPQEAGY